MYDTERDILAATKAGASGYALKDIESFCPEDVIRATASGVYRAGRKGGESRGAERERRFFGRRRSQRAVRTRKADPGAGGEGNDEPQDRDGFGRGCSDG